MPALTFLATFDREKKGDLVQERSKGLLMASTTALSWAALAIGLKLALSYSSPGTIVWFRMLVAFIGLTSIYLLRSPKQLRILWHPPILGIFAGVCLAANYFGYMKGVELTSASNTQIMIQTGPLTLILIGIFYFKEIPTRQQTIGFLVAATGFFFFYWDQILAAAENSEQFILGDLWIAMAALTWALFATFQKILSPNWTPQQINILIYTIATLALLPLSDTSEMATWSWPVWLLMLALGLNTIIAYGALGEALKRIPASQVSLIISLNPLLTLLLMAGLAFAEVTWIAPEPIDWRGYLGALLVVSGVALAVSRKRKTT